MLRPLRRSPIPSQYISPRLWARHPQPTTLFHSTSSTSQSDNTTTTNTNNNHYETLQISPDSTTAQIKSQFYTLSKSYHPDHNRNDPNAANRFVQISEAYAILGSPAKRERYDRELLQRSAAAAAARHSSTTRAPGTTGPAGGRPASGLSRRRTQFKGPPPSFYRSGGWGAQYQKRTRAQAQAQTTASPSSSASSAAGQSGFSAAAAGAGLGNDVNDVPHFDREAHFRTQESHEERWRMRRRRMMAEEGGGGGGGGHAYGPHHLGSLWVNFFFVGGILALVVGLPTVVAAAMGEERSDRVFPGAGAGKRKGTGG